MRKIVFFVFILLFIMSCGEEKSYLRIWLLDAPPPHDVENIYLTVLGVGIRDNEGEVSTIQADIYTVDILKFVGGKAASLTYNYSNGSSFVDVEPGEYKSVLLALSQINWVGRGDSVQDSLLIPVPADSTFEYELDKDFTIFPGERHTIVIDFDASKSINWETSPYELTPHFRIFEASEAGFIRGSVKDASGSYVNVATIYASSLESSDTMSTLSMDLDTTFSYCLMLPEGSYNISASAEDYTSSDALYENVVVNSGSVLEGYDFTLE